MITELEEYISLVARGEEPLLSNELAIDLRVEIQNGLFGGSGLSQTNIQKGNNKFYRWVWGRKNHNCEESGQPIFNYSSVHVSHILSRGAFPEMRWDPRNTNILMYEFHMQWEDPTKCQGMNIWEKNQEVIKQLVNEYSERTV